MKLKDEYKYSNKILLNFQMNKNQKPFKVLQITEKNKKFNNVVKEHNEILPKTILNPDNQSKKFDSIKSSIFHIDVKSKEKILDFPNDKISKDKKSVNKAAKNNSSGNFSHSLSSKHKLPEIKDNKLPSFNLATKNKTASNFFKPSNKKSSISLKKDVNLDELGAPITLKRPKRPSTNDGWKSFFNKNSTNHNHHFLHSSNKTNVNETNFENINQDCNQINSFALNTETNNDKSKNNDKASDYYESKINKNLNTFILNRQNNENLETLNTQFNQGMNSIIHNRQNVTSNNKPQINISTNNNNENLHRNFYNNNNNKKVFKIKPKIKFMSKYNSKPNINYNNPFRSKENMQNSDGFSKEFNANNTNSTTSPKTITKYFSTANTNQVQSFNILKNPIENIKSNENILNLAGVNLSINSNLKNKFNHSTNNNQNSTTDLKTFENFNSSNALNSIPRVESPLAKIRRNRCFTPLSPTDENILSYKFKKNRSLQNFFHPPHTENAIYITNNFNPNNHNNSNVDNNNDMLIQSYLNIHSSNTKQITSAKNIKKHLMRPKTVNGFSNFKFNAKINQETYKSIQDVLVTPTNYLPFSRKRDRLLELEKQSYIFQDKVEKELKIAKTREARKIKIKSKNELSNYLMRDYYMGEKSNAVEGSKKRLKMTKDFERNKEVQKKKKMAFLKNEEYKETDQEDLSDSDERELYELNEEENKNKLKINSEGSNCSNKNNYDDLDKEEKVNLADNNEYFNQVESRINTESNFNQSNNSNVKDYSKENLNRSSSYLASECSKDLKPQKEKIPKKPTLVLGLVQDAPKKNLNFEDKQDESTNINNENVAYNNSKKRNNLANRKKTNATNIINNSKRSRARKETKLTNNSHHILINDNDIHNNNSRKNSHIPYKTDNNSQIAEEQNFKPEALSPQELSKNILSKKLNFIKNLPLEKLQELINTKKKKLDEQILEGIKTRSEIKADQILDISLNDYSDLYQDVSDGFDSNNIKIDNLNRVIRIRNILKGKFKDDEPRQRYKKIDIENQDEINKIIRFRKLGPPSFLKTNFKKETIQKFKMLGGKFFGCQV